MEPSQPTVQDLRTAELEERLAEAEETLRAIRAGEVDALLVARPEGDQVFTLQGAETPYRFLVEEMNEGALLLGPEGTVLYGNVAFAHLAQVSFECVIGVSWERFFVPADQLRLPGLLADAKTAPLRQELLLEDGNGSGRPVSVSLCPMQHEGVRGFAVVVTDLTAQKGAETALREAKEQLELRVQERTAQLTRSYASLLTEMGQRKRSEEDLRESERRLTLALEGGQMGFWEWNLLTNQVVWNAREYELLGLSPSDERPSADLFFQHVHREDAAEVAHSLRTARETGRDWEHEFRIVRPDGQVRWLAGAGRVFHGADGQPEEMVGVNYDITERKAAEAVLARDKEELERLVAQRTASLQELVTELEHFSYSITHDMRAPLRAVSGFAEMAAELCGTPKVEEQKGLMRRIGLAATRMDNLIRDALSYNEAIRKHLPLGPVDASLLLRGMLDTYPEFHPARAGIHLQPDIPLVFANEAGLTQCFSNLLNNALKFAKPGQAPAIRIWAEFTERPPEALSDPLTGPHPIRAAGFTPIPSLPFVAPGSVRPRRWVRIWVEDQGIGISDAMLPRVFNLFTRGSEGQVGTGVGLALVRKVVDRMGGRVGVESREGQGSRFWLELLPADRS